MPVQTLRQCDQLRIALGVAFASLTLAGFTALTLAGTAQLGDRHCFVELGDRTEHLAHQLGRGRVVDEGAGVVCRDRSLIPKLADPDSCCERPTGTFIAKSCLA
jgi:hypothetical protein